MKTEDYNTWIIVFFTVLFLHLQFLAFITFGQPVERFVSPHLAAEQIQRNQVRNIFTSQIGVREKQLNSGPEIEEYLRYVSLPKGNPWCAAFVCWVYGKAGVDNPRTGWSPGLFKSSLVIWERGKNGKLKAENGKLKAESSDRFTSPTSRVTGNSPLATCQPSTGDVFGIYFPEKKRIAHVGFIETWDDPWVVTVEGNTNIAGSREGDGVYRKRRLARSIYQVARYIN